MKIKWHIRSLALILFFGALALTLSAPATADQRQVRHRRGRGGRVSAAVVAVYRAVK